MKINFRGKYHAARRRSGPAGLAHLPSPPWMVYGKSRWLENARATKIDYTPAGRTEWYVHGVDGPRAGGGHRACNSPKL